ncbi:Galactosyltransferases [Phaffia rhodozyma]|uniref:Galactosyltransferases n=1 Tax=Phaffia rhodozyma TaxID=264483 RepID=A0A0F7SUM7_PHARH|nr:Galactosyltransferases [Phaffia rhodozyma]
MGSVHRRRASVHHPPPSPAETITPSSLATSTSPTSYHHPSLVNVRPRRGSRYVYNRDPDLGDRSTNVADRSSDNSQQDLSGWVVDRELEEQSHMESFHVDEFSHMDSPSSTSSPSSSSSSWADFSDRDPSRHTGSASFLTVPEINSAGSSPQQQPISLPSSSSHLFPSPLSPTSTTSFTPSSSRRPPSLSVRIPSPSEPIGTSAIVSRPASARSKPHMNRNPSSVYYDTPMMTSSMPYDDPAQIGQIQPQSQHPHPGNYPPSSPDRNSIHSATSDIDLLPIHLAASTSSASVSPPPSPLSNRSLPPYTPSSHKSVNPYFTPYLDLHPSASGSSLASSTAGLTSGPYLNSSSTTPFHSAYASPYATPGIFPDSVSHSEYFPNGSYPPPSTSQDGVVLEKFTGDPSFGRPLRSGHPATKDSERPQSSFSHQTQSTGRSANRLQSVPQGQVVKEKISSLIGGTQVGWNRWWRKQARKRSRASSMGYDTMGSVGSTARASGRKTRRKTSKLVAFGRWAWRWVPERRETYILAFFLFIGFAWSLTMFLMWFLNPDKRAVSWHPLCLSPHPSYHSISHTSSLVLQTIPLPSIDSSLSSLHSGHPRHTNPVQHALLPTPLLTASSIESDALPPVGVFVGVFSTDKSFERRMLIRSTWASRHRMEGKGAHGLGSVRVRFILGRPSWRLREQVMMEMETYGDIVLLDITENMNSGKTQAYFSWAAENAMVPSISTINDEYGLEEKPPNYIVKADEDSFVMLGELEKRLRILSGKKIYWGYLVKNQFMGGECYALSLDLVRYVSTSPAVRDLIHGAEDKLVARWMHLHPEKESILWVSDACFFYDHPKAGTVYSHGFLYPNTVQRIRADFLSLGQTGSDERRTVEGEYNPTPGFNRTASSLAYSSVCTFGRPYRPPLPNLTPLERVEALVEGSEMSLLSPYSSSPKTSPLSPETVMKRRPSMNQRYLGDWEAGRWGRGTVVVHYVKNNEWFLETALAFLGTTGTDLGGVLGGGRGALGALGADVDGVGGGGSRRSGALAALNAEIKVDTSPDAKEIDKKDLGRVDLDSEPAEGLLNKIVERTKNEDGVGKGK